MPQDPRPSHDSPENTGNDRHPHDIDWPGTEPIDQRSPIWRMVDEAVVGTKRHINRNNNHGPGDRHRVGTPEVSPLWPPTYPPHQYEGCNEHRDVQHPIKDEVNRRHHEYARMRRDNCLRIEGQPPVVGNRHSPAGLADQSDRRHESQDVGIMQRQSAADIPVRWEEGPDRLKQSEPQEYPTAPAQNLRTDFNALNAAHAPDGKHTSQHCHAEKDQMHGAKHLWRRVCRELCRHNV